MLDLSIFDLIGLQSLHTSYTHIIEDHNNALTEINKKNDPNLDLKNLLELKIKYFKQQLELIVNQIDYLANEKVRFSIEDLFMLFGLTNQVIQVFFLTTSSSYKKYGPYVTGTIIYSDTELKKLLTNLEQHKRTDGRIRFIDQVSSLDPIIIDDLKNLGFYASEISHIY